MLKGQVQAVETVLRALVVLRQGLEVFAQAQVAQQGRQGVQIEPVGPRLPV
jgi:hypothetical protein